MGQALRIAHRGGLPENTLEAFARSIALSVDGVECDVHSWDGELVVIHDPPTGPVRPTFRELLELLAPHPTLLFAECKPAGITEPMVRMIEAFDRVDRTIFGSFLHDEVAAAKRLNPRLRTCALVERLGRAIPRADIIGLSADGATPAAIRRAGVPVWVYTVNDPAEMRRLIDAGAAAVFTDRPELWPTSTSPTARGGSAGSRPRPRQSARRSRRTRGTPS